MRALLFILGVLILSSLTYASISTSSNQITIDFDYVYKDVYIAQQGDTSWTKKSCTENALDQYWHDGCQISTQGMSGTYFVATYACNAVGNGFDCNNNQWRVEEIILGEQSSTDFSEKPAEYLIGSGKDLLVNLGDDYTSVDSATFQVWHFDEEQVQGDMNDYSAPFVYPGSVLNTVSPGKASVEVFLRENGVTVKTLKFDTTFVAGQNPTVFACSDGLDNDNDGKVDLQDPGCSSSTDNSEYNANAPSTCSGDCTTRSITQYGITWTFDREYEYGTFVNGDYWVKGPVTLTGINVVPKSGNPSTPTNGRNGFEISPGVQHHQAYDNRAHDYAPSKQPSFPVVVAPDNNIVSSISTEASNPHKEYVHTIAVLTVVDQVPPGRGSDVFRPPYTNPSAPYTYATNIRVDKLPSVEPAGSPPNLNAVTFKQNMVQFMNKFGWKGGSLRPKGNLKPYPVDMTREYSQAMLLLTLNTFTQEQKMPLLIARIQAGVDLYEMVKQGVNWDADGGHNSGRLLTITLAGHMLDDQDMLSVSKKTGFAEIHQTFYTTKNPPTVADYPLSNAGPQSDCYQQLPSKYAINVPGMGTAYARYATRHGTHPQHASLHGEYRLCADTSGYKTYWHLNAPSWVGQACAARLFGIEDAIDHPAFFDHMDRFMDNDIDNMADWMRDSFSDAMWYKHCDPWR